MKAIYVKRLLKLADFLQTLPKHKFDFGQFAARGEKPMLDALKAPKEHCGSVACAIGWMPAVFPRSVCWLGIDQEGMALDVGLLTDKADADWRDTNFQVAQKFFGIYYQEARDLFNPDEHSYSLHTNATPKQVAASIRRFVKRKQKENER